MSASSADSDSALTPNLRGSARLSWRKGDAVAVAVIELKTTMHQTPPNIAFLVVALFAAAFLVYTLG
jgi:hypothetical protein